MPIESDQARSHAAARTSMVAGGPGFIGSEVVRTELAAGDTVINLDTNPYAGDPRRIGDVHNERMICAEMDVADSGISSLLDRRRPELVVHFATETDVTRSESNGHHRYSINATRLRGRGWSPLKTLTPGLEDTVRWYRAHEWWWQPLVVDAKKLYAEQAVAQ